MGLFDFLGKMFFPHMYMSWGDGGDESRGGSAGGYEVVPLPQYDFTEPRYRAFSDFATSQLGNLQEGQIPEWLRKQLYGGAAGQTGEYAPGSIGYGLQRQNQNTYYGLPGQRTGVIPTALSAAAITGAGAGPANRAVSRAGQNYAQQAQRIDEFIAEQGFTGSQNTLNTISGINSSIPKGPDAQIVQRGGYPAAEGTGQQTNSIFSSFGSLIPGISGMFGNNTGGNTGNTNFLGGFSSLVGGSGSSLGYTPWTGYNGSSSGGGNSFYQPLTSQSVFGSGKGSSLQQF